MQIMKLAGIRPVTSDMMSQGDDKHDETELANSPDGYTNDQKVQSLDDLLNTHSGGLNRQKVQVKMVLKFIIYSLLDTLRCLIFPCLNTLGPRCFGWISRNYFVICGKSLYKDK